jgi:hypothetical protein
MYFEGFPNESLKINAFPEASLEPCSNVNIFNYSLIIKIFIQYPSQ